MIKLNGKEFNFNRITLKFLLFTESKEFTENLGKIDIAQLSDNTKTFRMLERRWAYFCRSVFQHRKIELFGFKIFDSWLFGLPKELQLGNLTLDEFNEVLKSFFTVVEGVTKASDGMGISRGSMIPSPSPSSPLVTTPTT